MWTVLTPSTLLRLKSALVVISARNLCHRIVTHVLYSQTQFQHSIAFQAHPAAVTTVAYRCPANRICYALCSVMNVLGLLLTLSNSVR